MSNHSALTFSNWLNLLVALSVFLIGLSLFAHRRLKDNRFLRMALTLWLAQWLVFMLIWARIIAVAESSDYLLLGLGDMQSLLAIGFALGFIMGEDLPNTWTKLLLRLAMAYVLLLVVNVVFGLAISRSGGPLTDVLLRQWVPIAQVLSLIADCSLGIAFLLRYGRRGLVMMVACVFYATLQSPTYDSLFGSAQAVPETRVALAAGKVVLAAVFYWLFLEPAANYRRIRVTLPHPPPFDWTAVIRRCGGTLLIGLVATGIAFKISPPSDLSYLVGTTISLFRIAVTFLGPLIALLSTLSVSLIQVEFTVNHVPGNKESDRIYITGDCQELGDWWPSEVRAAGPMQGDGLGTWTYKVGLPARENIKLKFLKIDSESTITWERGKNHECEVPEKSPGAVPKNYGWQHH